MTTKSIKQNDSSFIVSTVKPLNWSNSATITADVIELDGTIIEADKAVSVYAGGTTASETEAGEYDIVLDVDNTVSAGSKIAIGSDVNGWQSRIVDGYDSSTKTITITECLDEDAILGSTVTGLDLSFTIDTTADDYDNLSQVQVYWKPDGDDITMTELWDIQSIDNQPAGLVFDFSIAYPTIYATVEPETMPNVASRAEQWLINYCATKGREFKLVVDNELTKELLINKMALMVGTGADIGDQMYERIMKQFEDNLSLFDALPIWIDDNQDSIMDEDEVATADSSSPIQRGL